MDEHQVYLEIIDSWGDCSVADSPYRAIRAWVLKGKEGESWLVTRYPCQSCVARATVRFRWCLTEFARVVGTTSYLLLCQYLKRSKNEVNKGGKADGNHENQERLATGW